MLATSASRPAILSETMRRVRLEKESVKRNCPARLSQLSGRCQPLIGGLSSGAMLSSTKDDEAFSVFSPESGGVRSSNGWHLCRLTSSVPVLTFVSYHGGFVYECQNQGALANV